MTNFEAQIKELQEQYDAEHARLTQWQREIIAKGVYYNSSQDNSAVEKSKFMDAAIELEKLRQQIDNFKEQVSNLKEQAKWQKFLAFKPSEIKASVRIVEILSNLQARLKLF